MTKKKEVLRDVLVLNGPNINLLGQREPDIYGRETYADLLEEIEGVCREEGLSWSSFQSNHEGALVDEIQRAVGRFRSILINPAAYTHTSIAILDALLAVGLPAVEVHLSDPAQREDFRHISYVRDACCKTIAGLGIKGYGEGLRFLARLLEEEDPGRP